MSSSSLIFPQDLHKWKALRAPIVRLYKKVKYLHNALSLFLSKELFDKGNQQLFAL